MSTPTSAAGLTQDPNIERSVGTESLKNQLLKGSKGQVSKAVSAVYTSSATKILFIGGEAESGKAESFADNFSARASNPKNVNDTGEFGGKSLCGQVAVADKETAACVWADNDTFGQFIMLTGGNVPELEDVMKRIRPQLEKKK